MSEYKAVVENDTAYICEEYPSGQWWLVAYAPSEEHNSLIEEYITEEGSSLTDDEIAELRTLKTERTGITYLSETNGGTTRILSYNGTDWVYLTSAPKGKINDKIEQYIAVSRLTESEARGLRELKTK